MDPEQIEALDCCLQVLSENGANWDTYDCICHHLALAATKDIDWSVALKGPDAAEVIAALEEELKSLCDTILTEIDPTDPEYQEAVKLATSGRFLLDIRRSSAYKARGVKQGFKENRTQADGPNFNYYAHVAKFISIRTAIFRPNRGTRRLAVKDVRTAFLQSHKYPPGTVKYICFKYPTTNKWRYFRQSGPIYGEPSAVIRWEDTIAPWFEETGFVRGKNEQCAFLHEERDVLSLLYVDDNLLDGEEDDIKWAAAKLDERFDCKDLDWLSPGPSALDYLGMEISQDAIYTYINMRVYILNALKHLGLEGQRIVPTPINQQIDADCPSLDEHWIRFCLTAVGILGWLVNTCRLDLAYTHSRIAQHMSKPTESMLQAIRRAFAYLKGTTNMGIAAPLYTDRTNAEAWKFYTDSDFAGNDEPQNRRRSQNGCVALYNQAPVLWGSKVSSVAFAHPLIEEAHADISSAAAEIFAASNATYEFLHLSYVAEEMGLPFPMPFDLNMDNAAAQAFAENSTFKSKLKHIDCRQEWVKTLRNKNIMRPVHCPSKDNLADLFTKILPTHDFIRLRDLMMVRVPFEDDG
jgi:hypothetical protein